MVGGVVYVLQKVSFEKEKQQLQQQIDSMNNKIVQLTKKLKGVDIKDIDIEELNFSSKDYPKVDGSTSTHPLSVLIACRILNVSCLWQDYYDGTKRLLLDSEETEIFHSGTHGSYVNLIEHESDLILVARLPSDDEITLAEEKGVELDIKPVALDAFVFILNKKNSVDSLTIKEIQDIYTGKITNWNEVEGTNVKINPYQRNRNSGSQELMNALVMKDLEMIDAPDMVLMGMMGPINMLAEDVDGIGYSVYFFEEFMAPNEEIKLCAVNDILPSYESIKSRKYSFTTEVYVAIRSNLDKNTNTYKLRDFLLSEGGQEIVKESGYVPINF